MAITLSKGQKVSLTKGNPGLKNIVVGLGWDTNKYDGGFDFDLDSAAFLLGENDKVNSDSDFIFYNNLKHSSGAVQHLGDNLTGEGDGDDEQVGEDFSIETAVVVCEIYRHNGEWKFNALGSGFEGGLEALCKNFGVNV